MTPQEIREAVEKTRHGMTDFYLDQTDGRRILDLLLAVLDLVESEDVGEPFCESCGSFHPVPRDVAHRAALKCKARL